MICAPPSKSTVSLLGPNDSGFIGEGERGAELDRLRVPGPPVTISVIVCDSLLLGELDSALEEHSGEVDAGIDSETGIGAFIIIVLCKEIK
jgi:hypothetical protein